jgi:hypothetical protein
MKDWTGNKSTAFVTLGASNHSKDERQNEDYYATDPHAVEKLLEVETFNKNIWECAVGGGHIANVLIKNLYNVKASDIVDRCFPNTEIIDFLKLGGFSDNITNFDGDIITNPPYKYAKEFVEKSLEIINDGNKVAMLLKIQFLESEKRKELFEKYPPKKIYVFRNRIDCWKNGEKPKKQSKAVCYAWYIWKKGYKGETILRWI